MIPQSTVERIIDAANIYDVVSEYVTLRRAGANYKGLCPFHDDKTPSFHVSPAKGICKCFSCGEGGNAVQFIMKQEQLTYYEALKFLGKKYGIEVEDRQLTPEQRQSENEREAMFAVNEWASNYYHDLLKNDLDGRTVGLAYFRNRGFRDDIINKFRLGFALDKWDAMAKEALKKGYREEYLLKTGLCYKRDNGQVNDKYRGRVMFPWFNVSGKIVAFGGRVLDSRTKGVIQKYINSPESQIYSKGRELYGLYHAKSAIKKEDRVYMVEGYTDVISMHQCGIENVVANSGTALSDAQIKLLHRFTNNITLLYDGDEAGIHAALRGTDMLLAEGMNIKILLLPDGDDPDSFARKHNAAEFKEYVEKHQTDFIIFKTNLLLKDAGRDPLKRAELTKNIIHSISVIPEEIVRSAYIHECSELLGVDEAVLLRETQKNRKQAFEELQKEKQRLEDRAKYLAEKEAREQASEAGNNQDVQTPAPTDNHTFDGMSPEEIEAFEAMHADDFPPQGAASDGGGQTALVSSSNTSAAAPSTILETNLSKEEMRFVGLEKMIMTLIARNGNTKLNFTGEDGQDSEVSLVEYVINELSADGLTFHSHLYAMMLNECVQHLHDEGLDIGKLFLYNQNQEISKEAVNLISERYQLSKGQVMASEEEMAPGYIQRLMLDYKYQVIDEELRVCQKQLNDPNVYSDAAKCNEVMQKYMQYSEVYRALAKALGERVLLK